MPKRSDIEKQIAALQSQLDAADTDDEVWIKDDSGREFKVTGRRATTVLKRFSDLFDEGGENEGQEEGQEEGEDPEPDPAPKSGYFGKRK